MQPASADANIALLRRALSSFNDHDPASCLPHIRPDFIMNIAGAPHQLRGRDVWEAGTRMMMAAFPDLHATIEDIFGAGDRVAVRLAFRGTHRGAFQGIPATGRPVEYASFEIYRVEDGLLAEEWILSDLATLMRQIAG